MQVILTPTAIPNMFGAGLHGFGNVPPTKTQVSAEWLNSVQMELVNIVISQGGTLDSLVFDQVTTALNSWKYSGTPTLLNGSQFFVQDGAIVEIESGGSLIMANGSTASFNGTTQFNGPVSTTATVTFTFNGPATFGNTVTFNKPTTFNDAATLTQNVTIGTDEATTLAVNSTSTFNEGLTVGVPSVQATNGKLGYDGSNLFIGNGASVNTIKGVRRDYVISDDTGAAFDDLTGCSVTMTVTPDEFIYARIDAKQFVTNSGVTCNLGIAATNGVDTVTILNNGDPDQALLTLPASTAINQSRPNSVVVRWKPTNDFAVPANNNWTIYGRHGVSGGTLTSSNVLLEVWR